VPAILICHVGLGSAVSGVGQSARKFAAELDNMETIFTPIASLVGGVMIGLASVLLMLALGRIAGSTGILTGLLFPLNLEDWGWRAAMIAGMISAPVLIYLLTNQMPELTVPEPPPLKWSDSKYGFSSEEDWIWARDTSLKRSSRSCGRWTS
jgi:MFS family permease